MSDKPNASSARRKHKESALPGDELIGQTIGRYHIRREIGRGGMATVYEAEQESMARTVAVKVLPKYFLHDGNFIARFEREVKVITRLEHPNIVPVYDFGREGDVVFVVLRYVPGGTLENWLYQSQFDPMKLVRPLQQIASALDYAHAQQVTHRDIKPGNILLDEHDNAYVSDFGIAHVVDSKLTGQGMLGTPAYMAPELVLGHSFDGRVDTYALGVMMYQILAGQHPFEPLDDPFVMFKHVNDEIPSLLKYRPDLPEALAVVFARVLAKNPQERYTIASEFADAYARALMSTGEFDQVRDAVVHTQAQLPPTPSSLSVRVDSMNRQPIDTQSGTTTVTLPALEITISRSVLVGVAALVLLIFGWFVISALLDDEDGPTTIVITSMPPVGALLEPGALRTAVDTAPGGVRTRIAPLRPGVLADNAEEAEALPLLTEFATAMHPRYSMSVPVGLFPADWQPGSNVQPFVDLSAEDYLRHRFQASNKGTESSFVELALLDPASWTGEAFFEAVYQEAIHLRVTEDNTLADGARVISSRVAADASLGSGELDVFWFMQDETLVVFAIFADDPSALGVRLSEVERPIRESIRLRG